MHTHDSINTDNVNITAAIVHETLVHVLYDWEGGSVTQVLPHVGICGQRVRVETAGLRQARQALVPWFCVDAAARAIARVVHYALKSNSF